MYGYTLSPIDYFDGCLKLDEFIEDIVKSEDDEGFDNGIEKYKKADSIISCFIDSMCEFKYWEGDIVIPVKIFTIPCEVQTEVGFICKQSNNGTTFVISPVELPHLEE